VAELRTERRPLILVVENEEVVCSVCRSILERHRFRVECAEGGEQCLAFYRDNAADIDLVLCDLQTIGGVGLIKTIRSLDESARVVLMTMSGCKIKEVVSEEIAQTCILLNKPFTSNRLVQAIDDGLMLERPD
jgi:two-component system, chemotaxis family, chemotaxis protein CheY